MANKRIKKKQQKMAKYFHNYLVDNEVNIFNGKRLRNYVLYIAKYYSTYGFSGSLSFQSIGLIKDSTRYAIVSIPNKDSENMSFGIFPLYPIKYVYGILSGKSFIDIFSIFKCFFIYIIFL